MLSTIVATRGSTYRKAGAMMLIGNAELHGLLSGGCLEEDIALNAQNCLASNTQKIINYNLKADTEMFQGLGLGCDGALNILLQPLTPENKHLGFGELLDFITENRRGYYLQSLQTDTPTQNQIFAYPQKLLAVLSSEQLSKIQKGKSQIIQSTESKGKSLISFVRPPINLLVCGAGPDVAPLFVMGQQLGWKIQIWDHRQGYLEQPSFQNCSDKRCVRPEDVSLEDLKLFDAAVIMTHHLEHDQEYLQQLVASSVPYIGLLGPSKRRDKLLSALECTSDKITGRVFGPVGLPINANTPASIALSILAQIQQQLVET